MEHIVRSGEDLWAVAARYGFRSIEPWLEANPSLADPGVLAPGESLAVPACGPRSGSYATGARHRVSLELPVRTVRIKFLDRAGEPRQNVPYTVTSRRPRFEATGSTDGEGLLELDVPARVQRLAVALEGRPVRHVAVGDLDPVDRVDGIGIRGAQGRLMNLGLYPFRLDGDAGVRTRTAVARFQKRHGLEVTGKLDAATRSRLREVHGC